MPTATPARARRRTGRRVNLRLAQLDPEHARRAVTVAARPGGQRLGSAVAFVRVH